MNTSSAPGETSIALAALPGKGLIRSCHAGCVHVTYGCVTLDFCRPEGFHHLAELVSEHPRSTGLAQLQYGHASLQFTPEQFDEFARMVAVAARQLEQLAVVRRLLSDFALG